MNSKKIKMKNILSATTAIVKTSRINTSKKINHLLSKKLLYRLSPLLILIPILLVVFLVLIVADEEREWLAILLYPVVVINVLFLDFMLWNYFEGKQKLLIWIIEFIASGVIIYLLFR